MGFVASRSYTTIAPTNKIAPTAPVQPPLRPAPLVESVVAGAATPVAVGASVLVDRSAPLTGRVVCTDTSVSVAIVPLPVCVGVSQGIVSTHAVVVVVGLALSEVVEPIIVNSGEMLPLLPWKERI